jgi:mRNA interferase RelE/StbE
MSYDILWHENALKDLKKIDKDQVRSIIEKIEQYLAKDPYRLGKPLTGHLKGLFRYRKGYYRVIYNIKEEELIILVLKIGKRDRIYNKRL